MQMARNVTSTQNLLIISLMLDLKTLRLNVRQSRTLVSLQVSGGRDFVIRGIEYKV
jgi:hypothetical protein